MNDTTNPKLFDELLLECAKNNYQKGYENARKEILEKIDTLYKDFVSRCDESLPEVINIQLQGVLMGISMVKTDIAKLNSQNSLTGKDKT